MDSLTDTVSLSFLRELVDWAEVDPLLTRLADVKQVRFMKAAVRSHTGPLMLYAHRDHLAGARWQGSAGSSICLAPCIWKVHAMPEGRCVCY